MDAQDLSTNHKDCSLHTCSIYTVCYPVPPLVTVRGVYKLIKLIDEDFTLGFPDVANSIRCDGSFKLKVTEVTAARRLAIKYSNTTLYKCFAAYVSILLMQLVEVKVKAMLKLCYEAKVYEYIEAINNTCTNLRQCEEQTYKLVKYFEDLESR